MKNIGIVTIYDNKNYGNRLQNLAVQHIFRKRGFAATTIMCISSGRLRYYLHRMKLAFRSRIQKQPLARRRAAFYRFNSRFLKTERFYSPSYRMPADLKARYDYFSAGSDQIWNYTYQDEPILKFHFLSFAEDRQKICISPSLGVNEIDEEREEFFRKSLQGFRFLSCREKQGAAELQRIAGKPCDVLIDPTLAVSQDEWRELLAIHARQEDPYIFVFFLDGMSEELEKQVREYASGKYRIINPSDPTDSTYSADPVEFVRLLSNARMVFTDSFHVTAFSINFHIPFYVFNRRKVAHMTSRIESVCEAFGMQERYIPEQKRFRISESCDFGQADHQLTAERKKFFDYLDRCFQD